MAKTTIRRRKKVRLEDVARVAAISPGTASMALAGSTRVSAATRKRVMEACRSLDYQAPRTGQRATAAPSRVGLLCIGSSISVSPESHLLHQLTRLAHQHRIRLEVASIEREAPEAQLEHVLAFAQPCDGLLLTGDISARLMRLLHEAGIVAGSMDLPFQDDPEYASDPVHGVTFGTDDRDMAFHATRTLLDRGHRRIAFISEKLRPMQSHHRWHEGYCLALLQAGITPETALTCLVGRTNQSMREAIAPLTRLDPRPTAAIVIDMVLVNPLMYILQDVGLDISPDATLLWGSPEIASPFHLADRPMFSVDLARWAQAGLNFAMSPPAVRLPWGSHVHVPWVSWNLSKLSEQPAQAAAAIVPSFRS